MRLHYLALMLTTLSCTQPAHATTSSRWVTEESQDKLDNSRTRLVYRGAVTTAYSAKRRDVDESKQAEITFVCRSGKTMVLIGIPGMLVADRSVRVSWRFDEKPPVLNQRWSQTVDNSSVALNGGQKAIDFIKAASMAKSLFIRIVNDTFGNTEATFELDESQAAIDLIRRDCRW